MATKKLFYDDPFLSVFSATVLSCETLDGGYGVVLDQTAFYPEGGGQSADHGVLGGARVLDVHEKDGVIVHRCDAALPVGAAVEGAVDWTRRFDLMQQHSGEHIFSGMICKRFHCDNVGFHLGADCVTVDFNAEIDGEALREVEACANRYLWEDHAVEIRVYRGGVPEDVDYRSKKALDGDVRIVTFPGADCCACCGTHVLRSGQVGAIKVLAAQRFHDGTRIDIVCGARAFRLFSSAWEQVQQSSRLLSVPPEGVAAATERVLGELGAAKLRGARMEDAVFARIAAENAGRGDVLLFEESLSGDGLRKLCDAVAEVCGGRCAVFSREGDGYRYAIAQRGGDLRDTVKSLNASLCGRGGGKPEFVQGSVASTERAIRAFWVQK